MSTPRMDPIQNLDSNRLINEKDPILLSYLSKYPPGYKSLLNDAHDPNSTEDDRNYSIYNSRN